MEALMPVITNRGLAAAIDADELGIQARVSHIAFGDAGGSSGRYSPSVAQNALVRERVRIPVGGGDVVGPTEISLQALLDTGPTFNINEVGFFLNDGTLLAIWADPETSLATKTAGVPLAVAYNLALAGIPPGSITLNISGPSVNLTIVGPLAQTAASFMRTWRRMVQSDNEQFTPQILKKWR